jgi:hypothetical protein
MVEANGMEGGCGRAERLAMIDRQVWNKINVSFQPLSGINTIQRFLLFSHKRIFPHH